MQYIGWNSDEPAKYAHFHLVPPQEQKTEHFQQLCAAQNVSILFLMDFFRFNVALNPDFIAFKFENFSFTITIRKTKITAISVR